VGPRTGEAVVAYIDKPGRFHSNKAIGCYFGLIPKQDASGRSNRLGHITREGPSVVRSLLVEAAWQGIRRCPQIREVYERIMRDDKQRKKIALVATAHYLLRAMLAMLQTGEVWRYSAEAA
jgi:transposase